MKTKLLFICISAYLGMSVSLAESLNVKAAELTPSQMDSVVAGISSDVWVSGDGSGFVAYTSSGTYSVSDGDNSTASYGYVAVIDYGGTATTDASATADGDRTREMNIQATGAFSQIQAVGVISINSPF